MEKYLSSKDIDAEKFRKYFYNKYNLDLNSIKLEESKLSHIKYEKIIGYIERQLYPVFATKFPVEIERGQTKVPCDEITYYNILMNNNMYNVTGNEEMDFSYRFGPMFQLLNFYAKSCRGLMRDAFLGTNYDIQYGEKHTIVKLHLADAIHEGILVQERDPQKKYVIPFEFISKNRETNKFCYFTKSIFLFRNNGFKIFEVPLSTQSKNKYLYANIKKIIDNENVSEKAKNEDKFLLERFLNYNLTLTIFHYLNEDDDIRHYYEIFKLLYKCPQVYSRIAFAEIIMSSLNLNADIIKDNDKTKIQLMNIIKRLRQFLETETERYIDLCNAIKYIYKLLPVNLRIERTSWKPYELLLTSNQYEKEYYHRTGKFDCNNKFESYTTKSGDAKRYAILQELMVLEFQSNPLEGIWYMET